MEVLMKKLVTISKLTLLAALAASNLALASKRSADDQGDNPTKAVRFTDPTDQQTPAGTTITLVSSEDESFDVSHDLAMLSGTIKKILGDSTETNQNFPLENISSATIQNIIPCLEIIHAANGNQATIKTELSVLITNLSPDALADLMNAANFLDIPQLLQLEVPADSTSFTDLPNEMACKIRKHWEQDILASNSNKELAQNIKNVCSCTRTSKFFYTLIHDPTWVCRLFEQIITSNKFDTAQILFVSMIAYGVIWPEGFKALLTLGAQINDTQPNPPPLLCAAQTGHTAAIEYFLAIQGIDVNHSFLGMTALSTAARLDNAKAVKLLLNAPSFDPNASHQLTIALDNARRHNNPEVVAILEEYQATHDLQALPVANGQQD
jgi:hypothetical protein